MILTLITVIVTNLLNEEYLRYLISLSLNERSTKLKFFLIKEVIIK